MGETFSGTASASDFRARGARRPPGAEEGEVFLPHEEKHTV